jgi:hypothetical protein
MGYRWACGRGALGPSLRAWRTIQPFARRVAVTVWRSSFLGQFWARPGCYPGGAIARETSTFLNIAGSVPAEPGQGGAQLGADLRIGDATAADRRAV